MTVSHISTSGEYRVKFGNTNAAGVAVKFVDAKTGAIIGQSYRVSPRNVQAGFSRYEHFGYVISGTTPNSSTSADSLILQRLDGSKAAVKLGGTSRDLDSLPRFSPDETLVVVSVETKAHESAEPKLLARIVDVATDSPRDLASSLKCGPTFWIEVRDCDTVSFAESSLAAEQHFSVAKLR